MGVQMELSAAGLVRAAIERGQGAGEDWSAFTSRHKQVCCCVAAVSCVAYM